MDIENFLNENPEYKEKYERLTDEEKQQLCEAVKTVERIAELALSLLKRMAKTVCELSKKVIDTYPNRRVVHLALYSKKKRTRKKNMRRILKDIARWEE